MQFGIQIRKVTHTKKIVLSDGEKIPYSEDSKKIYKSLGVIPEIEYSWATEISGEYKVTKKIKEVFDLKDEDLYLYIYEDWLKIATYNTQRRTHNKEVKKIYCKLKELGYNVTHICEEVTSKGTC